MRKTMVLSPLCKESFTDDQQKDIKDRSDRIKELLDDMKYGDDINFDEFLNRLGITEQQYISAVRFSLNYKSVHLRVWQANMDMN